MKIRILETAKEDLRQGWRFYEKNAPGLGNYFLEAIEADVKSLIIYAGIHEVVEGLHRMLASRFPFAIYYQVERNTIDIYAILDCRRDPDWIVKRLLRSKSSD